MTMLAAPDTDFVTMLADWGQAVTIVHTVVKELDAISGDYTKSTQSETKTGIVGYISKKDMAISPSLLKLEDKTLRIRNSDFSFAISKNDTVTIDGVSYSIVEMQEICGIQKLYLRRH